MDGDQNQRALEVILCSPSGFCAGVERAIEIVERALKANNGRVYVRHEIVHNYRVVEGLRQRGAEFVEEVEEIPPESLTIFSAHGVSKKVERAADARNLSVIDATCPLVSKVHIEGQKYAARGYEVILIGHRNHPEVEGTMGRIEGRVHLVSDAEEVEALKVADPTKVAYISQTTLCADDTKDIVAAIKRRFPEAAGQNLKDICYATHNRQKSAKEMAKLVDVYFVIGSGNSSNSRALWKIGKDLGLPSYLLAEPESFRPEWIKNAERVGITSGASTPEEMVRELVDILGRGRRLKIRRLETVKENISFNLPRKLAEMERQAAKC